MACPPAVLRISVKEVRLVFERYIYIIAAGETLKAMKLKIDLKVTLFIFFCALPVSWAKTVKYELTATKGVMNLSGKTPVDWALRINGSIPAPTLEFTEGDDAEITVKNEIPDESLSLHWHGILLPPLMDGVHYITTPPIKSGESFQFKFRLRQHGTYWYHSHTSVQEQKGIYGAIVIHPKKSTIKYDRDLVVVLSDWSDEKADQIMNNLRKDGDYYIYKKNTIRSWLGAIQQKALGSFLSNEWTRMGGMDLSDVGYDAFLINGKRTSHVSAKAGETFRLRIINGSASSYFYVSLGKQPLNVISADGIDIEPIESNELLLGMAETYDVLFKIPENKSYELKSTAQDVTGAASLWIGEGSQVPAKNKISPNLYASMDHSMHKSMDHSMHDSDHSGHHSMHHQMITPLSVDQIKAKEPTQFQENHPTHDVQLVLNGDMERYVWHINGKAIFEDRTIEVSEGDVVRFHFENKTMMHHPMHLHGHFFRVLNQYGKYSPLKHTVDVPPHGSRTIEFLANEPGQWMFHCHNLYHMKTGMSRIVSYKGFKPTPEIQSIQNQSPMFKDSIYSTGSASAFTNKAALQLMATRTWDDLNLRFESSHYDNLEHAEGDLWYRRWISKYLNWIAGVSFFSDFEDDEIRAVAGVGYVLPFLIESSLLVDHEGKLRLDLEKKFQWSKYIFSDIDVIFRDGDTDFEASLMYAQSWSWAAGFMWSDEKVGAGLQVKF